MDQFFLRASIGQQVKGWVVLREGVVLQRAQTRKGMRRHEAPRKITGKQGQTARRKASTNHVKANSFDAAKGEFTVAENSALRPDDIAVVPSP